MLLSLYSLIMRLAQPLLRRKLRRRGVREPGYLTHVEERFGHYTQPTASDAIWIHAVSLGETRAAAILLQRLREALPGMRVLLTHGTATGRAEGERLLQAGDAQVWQPWDTPEAVARFLDHFKPRIGLLMETEVWPNLVAGCRSRGVPLALVNARLSARSLEQAVRLAPLSRPAYAALAAVWAQTEADAQRLRDAGACVGGVFGNLKFDASPDAAALARGRAWRATSARAVVMFASSREGEEALLLDALAARGDAAAGVQWLIVPRHPQRFDAVDALARARGLRVSRRGEWGEGPPREADVWLGDSLGEMALYYGLSDVALLGGSFEPLGGQNLIEAAACGCPVVMGPHTFNFDEAAQLAEAAGAALRVADMHEALSCAIELTRDAAARAARAQQALAFASTHRGAAARTTAATLALMASTGRQRSDAGALSAPAGC